MNAKSPPPGEVNEEIFALITTLHEAGQRLEELTAGEVDTVADRDGRAFLLQRPQEQLRGIEAARRAADAENLRVSELRFREMAAHIRDVFFLIDAQTDRVLYISPAYEEICGRNGEALYGKAWTEAIHPDDREAVYAQNRAGSAQGKFEQEYRIVRPDGAIRWINSRTYPVRDDAGKLVRVAGVARDITEAREAAQNLRESERRFSGMLANVELASVMLDREARITYCNDYLLRLTGWRLEEVVGRDWFEVFMPAELGDMKPVFAALLENKPEAWHRDNEIFTRSGDRRMFRWNNSVLRSGAGDVVGTASIGEDITERIQATHKLLQSESRFRSLTMLSSDWFWEQDEQHRFVKFSGGESVEGWGPDQTKAVGMHRWDLGGVIPISCSWKEHKRLLDAHTPFRNFEYSRILGDGRLQYVEASGEPIFDASGAFTGYRGVATEITERKLAEQDLLRFRAAMDSSGDAIVLVDRTSMRYIDVNQTLCDLVGYTRQEVIGMTPMDLFGVQRDVLERDYDAIVANTEGTADIVEGAYRHKNGSLIPIETRRRAMRSEQGWIIVGSARDITDRKISDNRIRYLNRVYAMLSGINALIVRERERGELFRGACRIAVEEGGFSMAMIGLTEDATGKVLPVASAGVDQELLSATKVHLSQVDGEPHGETTFARAIREKRAIVSDVSSNNPTIMFGRKIAGSTAVLPLSFAGVSLGVFALYADEAGAFDENEMKLLEEVAGNIAFAVEQIDKAAKLARTSRVNAMLSGINGAIVRHPERNSLFGEVCRIAVTEGGFTVARVIERALNGKARIAASSESDTRMFQRLVDDFNNDPEHCQNLLSLGLRTGQVLVSNDVANDARIPTRVALTKEGNYALALLPILVAQRIAGMVILRSREPGMFDEGELHLLREMISNVSFALEHIENEAKVRRLTRVYAVLSGINTLIVRVRRRDELFREACRIAVEQGKFTMAWLGMVDRNSMTLVPIASAGSTQDHLSLINQRFSLGVDAPLGNTFSARAIRERRIAFSNDVQNDPEVLFKEEHAQRGSLSMAMLPLQIAGEVVGILALYSDEVGFFDEEELKLLNELAGDVAFAIDNLGKQERLDYLAYYDVLTGLANRTLFLERLSQYMRSAVAGGHKLALFFLDLERFRNINDSLGRPAGDELLKQVADWLTLNVGDAGLLARVGADHFAILLPELTAEEDVASLLDNRIGAFLNHSFRLQGTEIQLNVKVGATLFPDDGADADTLLRNAEVALKKAKERGERYLFYKQKMNAEVAGKLTLENQLRQAIENREFVLHYQPKVDLTTGKLTSCEALIRWNDPRTGLVPPGRFIPVLEETGLIYDVGRWALRQAISDYLRWRAAGLPAVRIAVNVSPLQLRNRGFVEEIKQVIGVDAAAAAGLELEITESLIMEDVKHSISSLQAIRDVGITVAIDDFGTGFSSLSYLAKLPVDTLKIDRSFVIDMTAGPSGLALVSTIINLAHSLKLKVVAEGVETEEQSRLLRLLRCNEMQGFLFSKPVPADTFEAKFLALQSAPAKSEAA